MTNPRARAAWPALGLAMLAACAAPPVSEESFTAAALEAQMRTRPVVLLGEIHDNAVQHRIRAQALELLLQSGARPAIAFEQYDRARQPDIDRARSEAAGDAAEGAVRLAALGEAGWNWTYYRPYLALALKYGLPVVAANLSRADAMRVAQEGYGAVFDPAQQHELGLDALPPSLLQAQQRAVEEGHCHQIGGQTLDALVRAQIARDATLARSIGPYLQRGVVLLTGNGHARRDIGVAHFLPAAERQRTVAVALIEQGAADESIPPDAYDAVFFTPAQARPDPCEALHHPIRKMD